MNGFYRVGDVFFSVFLGVVFSRSFFVFFLFFVFCFFLRIDHGVFT